MRSALVLLTPALTLFALACAPEDSSDDRSSAPANSGDAGADAATTPPAPNGGRDDTAASCFAACSITEFACQAKSASGTVVTTADLVPEGNGCVGTLTSQGGEAVTMTIDCVERKVCVAAAPGQAATSCSSATFSAFSFGYGANGGVTNVCTRN